jgi:hypothetical protein
MDKDRIISAVIIGDSVAMPREFEKESTDIEQTWPFKLAKTFPRVHWVTNFSGGRSLIEVPDILNRTAYYYTPSFIILCVGIVDCSYRVLTKYELKFLKLFPRISIVVRRFVKKNHYFLSKKRKMYNTKPNKFEKILKECIKICDQMNSTLICIPILNPGENLVKKSFNIKNNVMTFNDIIRKNINRKYLINIENNDIDVNDLVNKEDGHHLNFAGHELYVDELTKLLKHLKLVNLL